MGNYILCRTDKKKKNKKNKQCVNLGIVKVQVNSEPGGDMKLEKLEYSSIRLGGA